MPKFEMKVSHLRCDLHASFKVKWPGHTVSTHPAATLLVTDALCRRSAAARSVKMAIISGKSFVSNAAVINT